MEHTTGSLADQLYQLGAGLLEMSRRESLDEAALQVIADQAAETLRTLARRSDAAAAVYPADDLAASLLADYDQRRAASAAHGGVVGVRTGLNHLDETINGLEPGKLYMLAAAPGAGKTTMALQIAGTVALAGDPALYLSLENDAADLARKTACRLGGVSYLAALKGKLLPDDWARAVGELGRLQGRLFLAAPRATMPDLATLVEDIERRTQAPPALIVVDYLQAWVKREATAADTADVRERVDRFTPALRALGERYGCAVLAISSQNRAGQQTGGMTSLKESGDLEYNADVVMTLMRNDDKDTRHLQGTSTVPLKLTVEKNRQGLTGRPLHLTLHGDLCMVEGEDR